MNDNTRARAWLRLAAVYFAIGVTVGVLMGASGDHTLFPVHAHLNLLGWASMALFGLIGTAYPAASAGRVAGLQFWLHNIGVPLMLGALALRLRGYAAAEPVVGIASLMVAGSVLLFVWLVFTRVGAADRPAQRPAGTASGRSVTG
jgi:hypothetical protein